MLTLWDYSTWLFMQWTGMRTYYVFSLIFSVSLLVMHSTVALLWNKTRHSLDSRQHSIVSLIIRQIYGRPSVYSKLKKTISIDWINCEILWNIKISVGVCCLLLMVGKHPFSVHFYWDISVFAHAEVCTPQIVTVLLLSSCLVDSYGHTFGPQGLPSVV